MRARRCRVPVSVLFILVLSYKAYLLWSSHAWLSTSSRHLAEHPNPSSVYRISVDIKNNVGTALHWDRSGRTFCSRIECPHPYEDHPHLINETKDNFVCLVSPHYEWQHADGCIEDARKIQDFTAPKWLNKKCVTIGHCME
eukprot:Selendium_serpulae@DN2288_c0_g1_i2.p1